LKQKKHELKQLEKARIETARKSTNWNSQKKHDLKQLEKKQTCKLQQWHLLKKECYWVICTTVLTFTI